MEANYFIGNRMGEISSHFIYEHEIGKCQDDDIPVE